MRQLPEEVRPIVHVLYLTGWRVNEVASRERRHLDMSAGWLRLEPGETKTGEGRMFPLIPELREVLTRQLERTRALELKTGRIVKRLFHRNGKPIRTFRHAWRAACRRAGLPGKLRHQFRRTAVRNLERAGVSRSAAMRLVGHQTEQIYQRYAIVAESDLREAGDKLTALGEMAQLRLSPDVRTSNEAKNA
jgi:integrase